MSVYTAPSVKPGLFYYFDPIDTLDPDIQKAWQDPARQDEFVANATAAAQKALAEHERASTIR